MSTRRGHSDKTGVCIRAGCWRPRAPKKGKYCHTHYSQRIKERHPEAYFLNKLRFNARRRGISCTLTLEQFKEFCRETGYLQKKGKGAGYYHIDRIDRSRGYEIGNIRILEALENTRKYHEEEKCPF